VRNRLDVSQRYVSLSALNAADIGTIEVAFLGKLFL
jgi:hypothetical protein